MFKKTKRVLAGFLAIATLSLSITAMTAGAEDYTDFTIAMGDAIVDGDTITVPVTIYNIPGSMIDGATLAINTSVPLIFVDDTEDAYEIFIANPISPTSTSMVGMIFGDTFNLVFTIPEGTTAESIDISFDTNSPNFGITVDGADADPLPTFIGTTADITDEPEDTTTSETTVSTSEPEDTTTPETTVSTSEPEDTTTPETTVSTDEPEDTTTSETTVSTSEPEDTTTSETTVSTSEPEVTTTTDTPAKLAGDINEDNQVNSADLVMMSKYLVGLVTPTANGLNNADMDNSGSVNSADLVMLSKLLVSIS